MNNPRPILYSFRRCPYAIRARMAIIYSGVQVELREVELKNKPTSMLDISPKATVPVLMTSDGKVIDESLDIMRWALQQHDPDGWLDTIDHPLIDENDKSFKKDLDHYKYADRFPEYPQRFYCDKCAAFLQSLEDILQSHTHLGGQDISSVDIAIFPFIRQCYGVDKAWFEHAPYPYLQAWLQSMLDHAIFIHSMKKYPIWQIGDKAAILP